MKLFKKKEKVIATHNWLIAIQWHDTTSVVNYEVCASSKQGAIFYIKSKLKAIGKEYNTDYGIVNIMEV